MAITRAELINKWLTLFADRWGRADSKPYSAPFIQLYAQSTAELTDDQFERACHKLFMEARFFPSPQEIIHAAVGSPEEHAEREWVLIMRGATTGERLGDSITNIARSALTTIGGSSVLNDSRSSISMLKRDFIASYTVLFRERQQQHYYPKALQPPAKELTEGEARELHFNIMQRVST